MMHTMQSTTGWNDALPLLLGVHGTGMILFTVGLIFLIVWSIKHLSGDKLKSWGIGLTIVGILLAFLTLGSTHGFMGNNYGRSKDAYCGMMKSGSALGMGMMRDDADMDDMMKMSMNEMSGMLEGKSGDDFDKAFLQGMIPHHQGAIDMAKNAETSAKHAEIKAMAKDIMSAQQAEIDQMNQWLKDWGYNQ